MGSSSDLNPMNPLVYVVEDELDVRELIQLHLKREGYQVKAFEDAESAQLAMSSDQPALLVLDWMLPKKSGLDLCKEIRAGGNKTLPVLLLTARADTMDKVLGLEIGADDYLTKPFEVRELMARVRALLRRATADTKSTSSGRKKVGPFELHLDAKKIFLHEKEIQLTPNEYKFMSIVMSKPGVTFERGELIREIQGPGVAVVDRTIDTTVLGLRKKLGDDAIWVETVRGFGYRFKEQ